MSLATPSGLTPAGTGAGTDVQPSGLYEFTAGQPFIADDQNRDLRDLQMNTVQTELAGVVSGGAITASGLTVSLPAAFTYFARGRWVASGTTSISVPDAATSYLWGCSDGILRLTASAGTLPSGFDATTACLLTKATAASGTATIDNTVQQKTRYADPSTRKVTDGPITLDYANKVIDTSGSALRIPSVTADPTVPGTGTFVWYRSDTNQLCVSISGTIKRSAAFT